MNRSLGWGVILFLAAPVQAMPPNPFQPQISPCEKQTEQLGQWALHGMIISVDQHVALMRSPQGTWRRVKPGGELFAGVHVERVSAGGVAAKLAQGCPHSAYRWQIKGKKYAVDADISSDAGVAALKSGQ